MGGQAHTAGSHEQRLVPFHDIDHFLVQRDLDHDLGEILWLVGRLVINSTQIHLCTAYDKETDKKNWQKQERKWTSHILLETVKMASCQI